MERQEAGIPIEMIFMILLNKLWVIILCFIIGLGVGFGVSRYVIKPTYSSKVTMYVNNNKERGDNALNINDINAAQKLVTTYVEILKSDTVLQEVIQKTGLNYSAGTLRKMILASSVNGTEILEVKVMAQHPEEAALIANTLSEVLPPQIIRVVQAGDVQLIDKAIAETKPVAPNIARNTFVIGIVAAGLASVIILLLAIFDNRIKGAEDLRKKYDLPVLGVIPDILEASKETK